MLAFATMRLFCFMSLRRLYMQIEKAIFYFLESLESEQLSMHSIRAYSQDLNQFMK